MERGKKRENLKKYKLKEGKKSTLYFNYLLTNELGKFLHHILLTERRTCVRSAFDYDLMAV